MHRKNYDFGLFSATRYENLTEETKHNETGSGVF